MARVVFVRGFTTPYQNSDLSFKHKIHLPSCVSLVKYSDERFESFELKAIHKLKDLIITEPTL